MNLDKLFAASAIAAALVSTEASAATYNLQAFIFCPNADPWCGYADQESLVSGYQANVAEMNLEYAVANISFRPLAPIIVQDNRFSTMTDNVGMAGNGEDNAVLKEELTQSVAAPPDTITLFLMPELAKCWNGIPCPGDNDGFDGDDVIFCRPPLQKADGRAYAHEMGHFWCLRHTMAFADSTGGEEVDHDYDDGVCTSLGIVNDTPGDPGEFEGYKEENGEPVGGRDADEDGNIIAWHEWCEITEITADSNSPHDTACTVECYQQVNGQTVATNEAPHTHNAMGYYGECRGPVRVGGTLYQAFSPKQIQVMNACKAQVPVRQQLVDACTGLGGDTDHDGWCNQEDACPSVPNTQLVDNDGDGVPNQCDTCPNTPDPSNLDTDDDGLGDVCDPDDDDDGCTDATDQHPKDDYVPVGTIFHINCPDSSDPWMAFEGSDSDHDGIVDCHETDDDDDGIPDGQDACPITNSGICILAGDTCPLNPIFFECALAGCNELFIKIVQLVNPDPTRELLFDVHQFDARGIVVAPLAGRTPIQTAELLRGAPNLHSSPDELMEMQLVDSRGRFLATIAVYHPTTVEIGSLGTSNALAIQLNPSFSGFEIEGATASP